MNLPSHRAARTAAQGRPKQGPASRRKRLAFVPSQSAQADWEPRHSPLSEAEPGHGQSGGLFVPDEGSSPWPRRDLQGRLPYPASGVSQ